MEEQQMERQTERQTEEKTAGAGKTFAIHTLGCKVNTYESDAISGRLRALGFQEVPFSEKADIYLINTCTVTNIADRKSRQMLHRARKKNEKALVVAAGCYVDAAMQNASMHALLEDRTVDLFVPNKDKARAAALILKRLAEDGQMEKAEADAANANAEETKAGQEASACTSADKQHADAGNENAGKGKAEENEAPSMFITELDGHTRAFLKVQDGCNQFCTYCIIPYVRGRIHTRPIADVVAEVRELTAHGVTEVVLNGIHLSSYGKEWMRNKKNPQAAKQPDMLTPEQVPTVNLPQIDAEEEGAPAAAKASVPSRKGDDIVNTKDAPLLALIAAVDAVEGITRIRLGSLEPRLMTEEFVQELSRCKKICPQFHLSLQSGSDTVLRRMNRHYDTALYREVCARLRRYYDNPAITTDIIAGFPGETEAEFQESLRFLKEIGFYEAHVFKYSRRAGTVADYMDGQVNEQQKAVRSEALIKEAAALSHAYRSSFLGKELTFLAEEALRFGDSLYLTGYTPEYVRCFKKVEAKEASLLQGKLVSGNAIEIFTEKSVDESLLLR